MLKPFFKEGVIEAGIDEAGRGCYAGPVVAAAVILPTHFELPLLNDSKQVTAAHRNILRQQIEQNALAWAVCFIEEATIDRVNILQATYLAMHGAVAKLTMQPTCLLVDGKWFRPMMNMPHHCFVKGDATYASIAAASILAKTHRDAWMENLHHEFPQYGWNNNKGYGTLQHRNAIAQFGLTPYHRKSFNIVPKQLNLF